MSDGGRVNNEQDANSTYPTVSPALSDPDAISNVLNAAVNVSLHMLLRVGNSNSR
jgi:hypothetical protein